VSNQEKRAKELPGNSPIIGQEAAPLTTPQTSKTEQAGTHNHPTAVPAPAVSDRGGNKTYSTNPAIRGIINEEDREQELERCRSDLEAALKQHERDMIGLMVECLSAGLSRIPENTRFDLRRKNLAKLRDANSRSGKLFRSNFHRRSIASTVA
jgi:hypothetical protein